MKIKENECQNTIQFKDVPHGDVFSHNKEYYIRTSSVSVVHAVCLRTGKEKTFLGYTQVAHHPKAILHIY